MNSPVIVSKGKNPYLTTQSALRQLPFPSLKGRKVLIKPNAGRVAFPGQGVTTHPSVVEATIDHLKEGGATDISIAESCIFGVNAEEAFLATGMKEVSQREGVRLMDLDRFDPMEIPVPQGRVVRKIKVPSILRQFDLIISIPVMKTHMHTQVTLSIKNMKGLLWRREKARFHHLRSDKKITKGDKELDIAISDMASVLLPHFAIIDGTVGMEGMGPAYGTPKKMGIVVAASDPVSADAVATRLMGFDPVNVPHLRLLAERGLGDIQLKEVSILPDDYLKWVTPFDPPPSRFSIPFPDVLVHDEGSCSACLSTLLVFLQNYYPQLPEYRLQDQKIHIGIGKRLNHVPEGTILIGNCASRMKREGILVQGCPPVASEIWDTLLQEKNRSEEKSS
jgi:uncharacterized protein (DUF362 family)